MAASFGPLMSTAGRLRDAVGALPLRPAVEIFAVGDGALPRAQLLTAPPQGLSGGPEAFAGSVSTAPATPYIAVADGGPKAHVLVTDTLRLRRRNMASPMSSPTGTPSHAAPTPRRVSRQGTSCPTQAPST